MTKEIVTAALLVIATSASAQSDTLYAKSADKVVVTANKYAQKQSNTGKVITVIDRKQIEDNLGKSLSQLLNQQAGITINGAYNNAGSVQTLYMRGAASGRALILLDGVPVNDPSMINNEFDLNLFSLNNIDRVEVCRGAQSTLYGSDAIAGVINIITVNPDIQRPLQVKATLSGGNLSTVKGNLQLMGKQDKLIYSVRYGKLYTDGFSSAYDSTGKASFDNDNYNGDVLNAHLVYQLTPLLSFKTFGMYSRYKTGIDARIFTDEKDYTTQSLNKNAGVGFNYKNDIITLNGTYQYSDVSRMYNNDSGYIVPGFGQTKFEENNYYGKAQFVEVYSAVKLGSGFTLLQGADFRYSSYNQNYLNINTAFGRYTSGFADTSLSQTGLYTSIIYNGKNNKLNIEMGGRLNTHSRYGTNYTYTINPSYAFHPRLRVFASVASGFKAPTLYQLSINNKLLAEESVNYEGGLQYSDNKLQARLVYFNREINNGIDFNYITFKYFNYVRQVVNGLEWELNYKPADKVDVQLNYTYLNIRETTQNRITNKDTVTYEYGLRRPGHNLNAAVTYQPLKKISVSMNCKYVGNRRDVGGYAKADVMLDDYFIVGAHLAYTANQHLQFFADGQNLTGKKFFDIRGYNSMPFMFNAGLVLNL